MYTGINIVRGLFVLLDFIHDLVCYFTNLITRQILRRFELFRITIQVATFFICRNNSLQ